MGLLEVVQSFSIHFSAHSLPYITKLRLTNKHIFTLRIGTAMSAETLDTPNKLRGSHPEAAVLLILKLNLFSYTPQRRLGGEEV
jgi:hypothetical protein